ncbi:hypothetical protein KC343_g11445 [Hortaea werneckii]|nr:hypothetical protein KC343_g11445 [Hortaea werneckii]
MHERLGAADFTKQELAAQARGEVEMVLRRRMRDEDLGVVGDRFGPGVAAPGVLESEFWAAAGGDLRGAVEG